MAKRQFRIGELAKALHVENYVVRFWEKEFGVSGSRSTGGQRFYTTDDLENFKTIKNLLYDHGFTIAGARKQLALSKKRLKNISPARSERPEAASHKEEVLTKQLIALKSELERLKGLVK